MSLKRGILKELKKGPKNVKQLKGKISADGKKMAKLLKVLVKENVISHSKGMYSLVTSSPELVDGTLVKLGRSFGFVSPLDASEDIFVPGHSLCGAMPGDVVKVAILAHPRVAGSREGEVVSITNPNDLVVGTVIFEDGRLAILPDNAHNTPLFIKRNAEAGVKEGDKAAGQILQRGARHRDIRVGVTRRFGSSDAAAQCAKAILYMSGIHKSFPDKVKAEAKTVSEEKITKEIIKTRKDLRKELIFTIDSDSTKDIDDAIGVKKTKGGYELSVHIADVSHYVRPKSYLDEEALARGTSVYYADSVVPMLPKSLSNGVCSLNPQEDRLAFSCIMELDNEGNLLDYKFVKTIICSRVKGVYEEINAIFGGSKDESLQKKYIDVIKSLPVMHELYEKLAILRKERGNMEIETDEPKLVLDENGVCVGVKKRTRGDSEKMIEEFMLMANNAAAHMARRCNVPFVYRVHEKPSYEKVETLKSILTALGVPFKFKEEIPNQKELSELLSRTRGTNIEIPVHNAVLRSMQKAMYEPTPKGHFGLGLSDYAHFTSPIRRYPDLAIHRILGDMVSGLSSDMVTKKYKNFAEVASVQSSQREVAAVQAERSCDDVYKAEYMRPFVGDNFKGVITSVVPFGVYVSLENTVEGLIHSSNLSEYRLELTEGICLTDPVSKASWKMGDEIMVTLAGVDVAQGNIDFAPYNENIVNAEKKTSK